MSEFSKRAKEIASQNMDDTWELYYWTRIKDDGKNHMIGRGEFVRLMFEAAGVQYIEKGNPDSSVVFQFVLGGMVVLEDRCEIDVEVAIKDSLRWRHQSLRKETSFCPRRPLSCATLAPCTAWPRTHRKTSILGIYSDTDSLALTPTKSSNL